MRTVSGDRFDDVVSQRQGVLDEAWFAKCFGIVATDLPPRCRDAIAAADFSYRIPDQDARDHIILDVIKRLELDSQKIGADERRAVWERGWREALNEYVESDADLSSLVPKFIRPNQPVRLQQQFVLPSDSNFELGFVEVIREWMFPEFFTDAPQVHEFGCGTGFNLIAMAGIFPGKQLYGSDFVPASVELVNKIGVTKKLPISAQLFDMTEPPDDYELPSGSGVMTFGALEQLAGRFEKFIAFLLARRPGICVHIEPTVELYDDDNLVDHLAIRFHRKRGYTEGFLPHLQKLETEGKVELIRTTRLNFGSLMMEGYNLIVWRPVT